MTRGGDDIPSLSKQGLGLGFCTQNADKDVIEVDLKDPENVKAVLSLIAQADIMVQNFRPGVAERLGIGEATVRDINPKIVYCSISAYGGEGPIGHRPAYDHVVQAMSGIMSTTGPEGSGPMKVGAPYVDYATGLNSAFAVLAALRERDRTGEGQRVDVAMLDTALNLMVNNVVATATTGKEIPKLGNEAASRAPSAGNFDTADGSVIALAANNERQFVDFCRALGHPEWSEDPRWINAVKRRENHEALRLEIQQVFMTKPARHWETLLDEAGVPASRVRTINELLTEGQPAARGLLTELKVGDVDTPLKLPGIGFRLNGDSLTPQRAPRKVGADNDKWL